VEEEEEEEGAFARRIFLGRLVWLPFSLLVI
jgi:hypothetical protein